MFLRRRCPIFLPVIFLPWSLPHLSAGHLSAIVPVPSFCKSFFALLGVAFRTPHWSLVPASLRFLLLITSGAHGSQRGLLASMSGNPRSRRRPAAGDSACCGLVCGHHPGWADGAFVRVRTQPDSG